MPSTLTDLVSRSGTTGPVVLGAGEPVEPVAVGLAEQPDQLVLADRLEVGDGVDAGPAQPLGRGRADARDHRHVHGPEQLDLGAGRDHHQPVGLVELAGDLGDELRRPDADRGGQPAGDLVDRGAQLLGDPGHASSHAEVGRPARARSTNASSRDSGSTSGESSRSTLHHPLAGLPVGVEPAAEERRVRAAGPGLARRHRRAHAVPARLVRRGGHHAAAADAADDDGLAAQGRLVALLDRGEERVEVQVQHGRVGTHGAQRTPHRRRPARRAQAAAPGRSLHSPPRPRCRAPCGPGTVLGMSDDRMTLTARGPEDVLAVVPVVLGFVPEDSLVMLTFGAAQSLPRARRPATRLPRPCARSSAPCWIRPCGTACAGSCWWPTRPTCGSPSG